MIDARSSVGVDVRRRNPFGPPGISTLSSPGDPPGGAVVDPSVAGIASESEAVDFGGTAFLPVRDVVDRAHAGRRRASGAGASAVGGDQRKPLIRTGQTSAASKMQGTAVMVEQHQDRVGLLGQRQRILDR